jgi:hypothetical protein
LTTNVIDLAAGEAACESRWSHQAPNFILYIDDPGFEKIVHHQGLAFTFAGDGSLIQVWKDWLATNPSVPLTLPATSINTPQGLRSITIGLVHMGQKVLLFSKGTGIKHQDAVFAGSGALHAHACWSANRDAKRAVNSAKTQDIFSGGPVKYLVFSCGSNNLNETTSMRDVCRLLATKGMVMYTNSNAPSHAPVDQAATQDPNVQQVVNDLSSGALAATAPCEAMYTAWSSDEIQKLRSVLENALAG